MADPIALEEVSRVYEALLKQALRRNEKGLPVQMESLAIVFGVDVDPDTIPYVTASVGVFDALGTFLTLCEKVLAEAPVAAHDLRETLIGVLGPWASQLNLRGAASTWLKQSLSEDGAKTLRTALAFSQSGGIASDGRYLSLRALIVSLINEVDVDELDDIEIETFHVLRQLLRAMDRGDAEAIREAALRLAGLVSMAENPPSNARRAAALAWLVLQATAVTMTIHMWTDTYVFKDECVAIEAEIAPQLELPEGDKPQAALPEGPVQSGRVGP